MKDEKNVDAKKSGNPILIAIIFVLLITFVFFIPEVYQNYNSGDASFYGIGSKNQHKEEDKSNEEATSEHIQIGSFKPFEYNDLSVEKASLLNNDLVLTISSNDEINLEEKNYYIEIYKNKNTYVGRRLLKGIVKSSKNIKVNVQNLNIDDTYYIAISHIADNAIPNYILETDESGLGELTCQIDSVLYTYTFNLSSLIKVYQSETFEFIDANAYAKKSVELVKTSKERNNYNGVTSTIVEDENKIILSNEFDYEMVDSFDNLNVDYLYKKGENVSLIKFKMDALGFDCK